MPINVAQLAVNVTGNTSGAESSLSGLGSLFGGIAGSMGTLAIGAGLAIAGIGLASAKMAGDFQSGMTSLVTGAGESRDNLKQVSDGILKMAVDTGTSTKQLTDGMYMIESAGFHGAAGLAILQAAAEGAKVGNAQLADVANGVTTEMTDYASKNYSAATATNILIDTVKMGKTHMQDLTTSLSQILPTAAAVGVALPDVAGAMATMTGEGVPAANAATYLRQTLMALDAPSKQTVSALASVGLKSSDVANELKTSLPDALKMITDAVGKKFPVGSAEYVSALKNIAGGSKQMQGILDLTGDHLSTLQDNVKNITGDVKKAGGSIEGWSDVQDTFNFKIDKAKEVVETLGIKLGTLLLPILGKAVDFFSDKAVPALLALADSFNKPNATLNNFAKSLGGEALDALKQLGTFITGTVIPAAKQFIQWFGTDMLPVLKQVGNIIFTEVVPAVKQLAGFILTDILPAAEKFVAWFGNTILPVLKTLTNVLRTEVIPQIENLASNILNKLLPPIEDIIGKIAPILNPILQTLGWILGNVVGPALNLVINILGWLLSNVAKGVDVFAGFIDKIGKLAGAIGDMAGKVGGFLTNMANKIDGTTKQAAINAGINADKLKEKQLDTYSKTAVESVNLMEQQKQGIIKKIQETTDPAEKAALEMKLKVLDHHEQMTQESIKKAQTAKEGVLKHQAELQAEAIRHANFMKLGVLGNVLEMGDNMLISVQHAIGNFLDAVGKWKDGVIKKVSDMVNDIATWIASIPGKIAGFLDQIGTKISGTWETIKTDALKFGGDLIQKIIDGITGMLGGLGTAAGKIADTVKNAVNNTPLIGGIAKAAGFAVGTSCAPGGLAVVGEEGPELVNLPRGAQVFTAQQTRGIMQSSAQQVGAKAPSMAQSAPAQTTGNLTIVFQMDGKTVAKQILPHIAGEVRLRTGKLI